MNALNDYLSALNWRNATKNFDSERKLAPELLSHLLEAPRLAPSSYGLQPWKFVAVQDQELRAKLRSQAWNQAQITDSSCVVVLCSVREMDQRRIDSYIDLIAKRRALAPEGLQGFREMMITSVKQLTPEANRNWMTHQVYIALGMLLSACAIARVDACPMEGFDKAAFDEILELKPLGITSAVLCAIGYRKSDPVGALAKKVRFDSKDVVIWR